MLTWTTDMSDIELEIVEPDGKKCNTFNNKTKNGKMSRNFTKGLGRILSLMNQAHPGRPV